MSGYTTTPNYGLKKPVENADHDAWGGHWNQNADNLDSLVKTNADRATQALNGIGRNLIHNPLFNIAQRGAGPFMTNGNYTADRWQLGVTLDTVNVQRVAISDTNRAAIGDETAKFLLTNTFTGNAGATANNFIQQPIEDAYRLAGKTVTVSFWANASAPAIGINIIQHFGTGGSPSASVYALSTGIKIALTTTWTRYSATITVPSVAGKTFGANNDSRTTLMFFCSSGLNNNAFAGNIGVQGPSATINLWGVQLEIGSVATPLEKPDPRYDLSNCQRFFQYTSPGARGSGTASISLASFPSWPQMRGVPIATLVNNGARSNVGASSLTVFNTFSGFFTVATSGAGDGYVLNETYALSADL